MVEAGIKRYCRAWVSHGVVLGSYCISPSNYIGGGGHTITAFIVVLSFLLNTFISVFEVGIVCRRGLAKREV